MKKFLWVALALPLILFAHEGFADREGYSADQPDPPPAEEPTESGDTCTILFGGLKADCCAINPARKGCALAPTPTPTSTPGTPASCEGLEGSAKADCVLCKADPSNCKTPVPCPIGVTGTPESPCTPPTPTPTPAPSPLPTPSGTPRPGGLPPPSPKPLVSKPKETLKCVPRPTTTTDNYDAPAVAGMKGPPQAKPGDAASKFASEWEATGQNGDLFCDTVKDLGTLSDLDSRKAHGQVLRDCAVTSIEGRKDDVCKDDPTNPECIGSRQALANATTCREYFDPAKPALGCKTLGAGEYDSEVWLAFAETYVTAASDCSVLKTATEERTNKKVLYKTNGDAWTVDGDEMLADASESLSVKLDTNANSDIINGTNVAQLATSESTVSGRSKAQDVPYNAAKEEMIKISKTIEDGASSLGYEEGEILRQTAQGKKFTEIVTESPFFDNLNEPTRRKIETGLADSRSLVAKVKTERKEMAAAKGEIDAQEALDNSILTARPELSGSGFVSAGSSGSSRMGSRPDQVVSAGSNQEKVDPKADSKNAGTQAIAAGAAIESGKVNPGSLKAVGEKDTNRKMTESERIAALAEAALKARLSGRTLASVLAAPSPTPQPALTEAELTELNLFLRIHQTYQKHRPALKRSETGKAMQGMDAPDIFKDL